MASQIMIEAMVQIILQSFCAFTMLFSYFITSKKRYEYFFFSAAFFLMCLRRVTAFILLNSDDAPGIIGHLDKAHIPLVISIFITIACLMQVRNLMRDSNA